MNRTTHRGLWLLLPLLLLSAGAQARSEEGTRPGGTGSNPGDRILRGHTLLFPLLQQSPIVSTHVGIREGLASLSAEQTPLSILGPRDVTLSGFQQFLDLSLRFTPWFAVYVEAQGQAFVGTNTVTLLRSGSSFDVSGDLGLAFRLLRNEDSGTQLTGRVFGGLSSGNDVTLLPLVLSLANAPAETVLSLLQEGSEGFLVVDTKEYAYGLSLQFAQVFSRAFSLQLGASARRTVRTESPFDVVLGTTVEEDLRVFRFNGTAVLTYDFAPHGFPVALMGEYLISLGDRSGGPVLLLNDSISSHTLALGVYYSGRPNLQLGVSGAHLINGEPFQGTTPEGAPAESESPTLSYTQLILRYIW